MSRASAFAWMALIVCTGCGRPADGIVQTDRLAGRDPERSYPRVVGYHTPASPGVSRSATWM